MPRPLAGRRARRGDHLSREALAIRGTEVKTTTRPVGGERIRLLIESASLSPPDPQTGYRDPVAGVRRIDYAKTVVVAARYCDLPASAVERAARDQRKEVS